MLFFIANQEHSYAIIPRLQTFPESWPGFCGLSGVVVAHCLLLTNIDTGLHDTLTRDGHLVNAFSNIWKILAGGLIAL